MNNSEPTESKKNSSWRIVAKIICGILALVSVPLAFMSVVVFDNPLLFFTYAWLCVLCVRYVLNFQDEIRYWIWAILACLLLSLISYLIKAPTIIHVRNASHENVCKLTLKALGCSLKAFRDDQVDKNFGTWEELVEEEYIIEGYTTENIIDKYTIVVFDVKKSTLDEEGNSINDSTFTMVAVPRNQKNRLRTFALSDDQTPRVWVGNADEWSTEDVQLHNIDMWEPLR